MAYCEYRLMQWVERGRLPSTLLNRSVKEHFAFDRTPSEPTDRSQEDEAILFPCFEPASEFLFGEVLPEIQD